MTTKPDGQRSARIDAFSSVAIWQLMAFVFLLVFTWVSETLDFPAIVFDAPPTPFNLYRMSILTAGIITAAIITIGHAYEQQRRLVKTLVQTCLFCHRVQNEHGSWEHVHEFFVRNFPVDISGGACPECKKMLDDVNARAAKEQGNSDGVAADSSGCSPRISAGR